MFDFKPRRDRATKLLNFLGNVIVNGNPQAKGFKPAKAFDARQAAWLTIRRRAVPKGTRDLLLELGPKKFAEWTLKQKRLLITDTTFRDAHQSLMATRVRTYDMLAVRRHAVARADAAAVLAGNVGRRDVRHRDAVPARRSVGALASAARTRFRTSVSRCSSAVRTRSATRNYPDNVVAGFVKHAAASGMDIFRIFDSLNYLPNLRVAMEAVQETHAICEAAICYTGDILDPKRDKYSLKYYVKLAKELEKMGAHFLAIKDMAGLCRPFAAHASWSRR